MKKVKPGVAPTAKKVSCCRIGNTGKRRCRQGLCQGDRTRFRWGGQALLRQPHFTTGRVVTDERRGYLPLKKRYPFLEQKPSEKGQNFPELHSYIMNIQGWSRGIHHHCSKEHLQGYLGEYHYRYNRRSQMETIFDNLVVRMVRYKSIQGLWEY